MQNTIRQRPKNSIASCKKVSLGQRESPISTNATPATIKTSSTAFRIDCTAVRLIERLSLEDIGPARVKAGDFGTI